MPKAGMDGIQSFHQLIRAYIERFGGKEIPLLLMDGTDLRQMYASLGVGELGTIDVAKS